MKAKQEHNKIEKKKATSKVLNCLKQQQAATDESFTSCSSFLPESFGNQDGMTPNLPSLSFSLERAHVFRVSVQASIPS